MIEYDSDGPDVAADGVVVFLEGFGGHVDWTAHVVVFVGVEVGDGDGEPKVSVFVYSIFVEDVGRFDVSVHESCLIDVVVALDELPHDFDHLEVGESLALLEKGVEISFAEFSDYIGVVFGSVDVVQVQDVTGTCEGTEGGNFEL